MKIGITGSFGSGKTMVAKMFGSYGYEVVSADKIGHRLLDRNKDKIVKVFGKGILSKGRIDRKKLKGIVFNAHKQLRKLNRVMWPLIRKELRKIKGENIVIDAAVLIEAKWADLVDKIIVVKCSRKQQMKRLLKKKKYTRREINNVIKSQLPLRRKLRYADYVVDNSKGIGSVKKQVRIIQNEISNLSRDV